MKIKLTSVHVDDQERALRFYTEVLGFVKQDSHAAETLVKAGAVVSGVHVLRANPADSSGC